jgi:amidase
VTGDDVVHCAATLGFTVKAEELAIHQKLLAAAYETFEELSALEDYHPPENQRPCLRTDVHCVDSDSNVFGNAWAYRTNIELSPTEGSQPAKLLAGKNIVVKDNISVAGVPQSNGSDALEPWIPSCDAAVVSRILEAGGRIVGTATCEALSCATVSNTAAAGPVYNPWATGYSAGGSSSGVAALVGNPIRDPESDAPSKIRVDMGLGADQGGSIRVPAAFCGLVGLKATHGLIPYTGVIACEPILDHVGPMCKTVSDTALLLEVIAGYDGVDDRQIGAQMHGAIKYHPELLSWYADVSDKYPSKPLTGKKLAILKEATHAPFVTSVMKEELAKTFDRFKSLGAIVEEISMPFHETGRSLWMAVCRQSLTSLVLGSPMGRRTYQTTGFMETLLPWTQEKWDRLPAAMRNELINGVFEKEKYPTLYAKCMNLSLLCVYSEN